MKNELLLLTELQSISSTNEKVDFISAHKDNKLFIKLLKFIVDDKVVTNISRAKFNKNVGCDCGILDIDEFLYSLEYICTGKDTDLMMIHGFIGEQEVELQSILSAIACKDLAIGVGVSLYNKGCNEEDKLLEQFYMGCLQYKQKLVDELFKEEGTLLAQVKEDGYYISPSIQNDKVVFNVRSGEPIDLKGKLVEELIKVQESFNEPIMLQGELLINSIPDRSVANGVINGLKSSTLKVINGDTKEPQKFQKKYGRTMEEIENDLLFKIWDIVPPEVVHTGSCDEEYIDRYNKIKDINTDMIKVVDTKEVSSDLEAYELFMEMLEQGREGIVLKSKNAPYRNGKHKRQLKYKIEFSVDLEIIGFNQGRENSKYKDTLGALICKSSCGTLTTKVSGISDKMRMEFWDNQDKYLGTIIETKCNGLSKNKNNGVGLYYPNFVTIRSDKNEANTWQEIVDIQESIKELKRKMVK